MKRILISLFAVVLVAGICVAQSAQSQASGTASQETSASAAKSGAQAASALQAGSTVQAQLEKPVDARKNKVGDEVVAKTTHDVKSNGQVVIPKGSKLIGHVTEVKAHSKDEATSAVGIAFDHAVLKNGGEMPLAMSIQAIGRSQASAAAMEDSGMPGNAGAMGSAGARSSGGGGGLVGGVGSTAGGVVNTAGNAAGGAVNTAGAAAGSAGGAVSGSLSSTSQGVVGMPGLSLATDTSTATHGSIVSANGSNVHLDSGTEMVLRVNQ
jgi:hypothetical protein